MTTREKVTPPPDKAFPVSWDQFHRPAKVGPLKGVGRVVLRGREVCQLSAELMQNDKIVATATATAIIRKM